MIPDLGGPPAPHLAAPSTLIAIFTLGSDSREVHFFGLMKLFLCNATSRELVEKVLFEDGGWWYSKLNVCIRS